MLERVPRPRRPRPVVAIAVAMALVLAASAITLVIRLREPKSAVVPLTYKGPRTRAPSNSDPIPYGPLAYEPKVAVQPFDLAVLIEGEELWVEGSQLKDGAIAQTPEGLTVVPYFGNIAAKTLVDIDPAKARLYMTWYIRHMNRPDRQGLAGTIYDYEMTYGGLQPTFTYDSADSYAATFLTLASYYLRQTGDTAFIQDNLDSIDLAASVILALQDSDGLIVFSPGAGTKFLMDNSESYRGLLDWADALDTLGMHVEASAYRDAAGRVLNGIQSVLYDPVRQDYAWSLNWTGKQFPSPSLWYPDNVSQIDLISCGVLSPDDPRAVKIWQDFNARFPDWDEGEGDERDGFPWTEVAQVAVTMGDTGQASTFLEWANKEYARDGHPYPWHVSESASAVEVGKALQALDGR